MALLPEFFRSTEPCESVVSGRGKVVAWPFRAVQVLFGTCAGLVGNLPPRPMKNRHSLATPFFRHPRARPGDDGRRAWWKRSCGGVSKGCELAGILRRLYFFFVALSLFFTCDPRVGAALAATLSFLGLRVSLLLRTCPLAIVVTPVVDVKHNLLIPRGKQGLFLTTSTCLVLSLCARCKADGFGRLQSSNRCLHRTQRSRLAGGAPPARAQRSTE